MPVPVANALEGLLIGCERMPHQRSNSAVRAGSDSQRVAAACFLLQDERQRYWVTNAGESSTLHKTSTRPLSPHSTECTQSTHIALSHLDRLRGRDIWTDAAVQLPIVCRVPAQRQMSQPAGNLLHLLLRNLGDVYDASHSSCDLR